MLPPTERRYGAAPASMKHAGAREEGQGLAHFGFGWGGHHYTLRGNRTVRQASLVAHTVKNLPVISPGEGNGYPSQYSYLGNPMDRGGWRAAGPGVAKYQKGLSY